MIHDRVAPRDGERVSEDSCPDCLHDVEECVCKPEQSADNLAAKDFVAMIKKQLMWPTIKEQQIYWDKADERISTD